MKSFYVIGMTTTEEEKINEEVRVISYQKEEDFLNALKELNRLLN